MGRAEVTVAPVPKSVYGDGDGSRNNSMFTMIPLLSVMLIAFTVGRFTGGADWITEEIWSVTLPSNDQWDVTAGHTFIMASMVFLFWELLRATKTGTDSIINHALSAILAIAALFLFVLAPGYGNSVFLIFALMTLLDFLAGFVITLFGARRDFGVS